MLRFLVAAVLLLPSGVASDGNAPEACGITVCAFARSSFDVACAETREGVEAVLRCTFDFTSFTWGRSPLFLPGRVFLGGDAQIQWSCTEGCTPDHIEKNVNAYALWYGGPFDIAGQGLGPGDGGDVPILTHIIAVRVPAGTSACLRWHAELETTALAETPHLPGGLPGGWAEEVLHGDGEVRDGVACLA